MYQGEGLATSHGAIGVARAQLIGGQAAVASVGGVGNLAATRQTTVPGLVSQAIETTNYARDQLESLEALSSRAFNLAQRLTGSLPGPGAEPAPPATGEKERPPAAALEGLGQCIGEIRRPLAAMNPSFARLVAALNAIEEALG